MRFWRTLAFGIGFLFAVALACQRAASTGMPPTPTFEVQVGGLMSTTPTMPEMLNLATPTVVMPMQEPTATPLPSPTPPPPTPTPQPSPTPMPPTPTPTPEAQQPQPSPTPTELALEVPERYVLQQGEYPYCIARRFNVDPQRLLQINGLTIFSRPPAGTVLIIPKDTTWPEGVPRALKPHPTTYVTQPGDTLYSVACEFGDVWPEEIAVANGIPLDRLGEPLPEGTTLQIP